jgi:hypothetical protein
VWILVHPMSLSPEGFISKTLVFFLGASGEYLKRYELNNDPFFIVDPYLKY